MSVSPQSPASSRLEPFVSTAAPEHDSSVLSAEVAADPCARFLPKEAREEGLRVLHFALRLGQQRHCLRLLPGVVHSGCKTTQQTAAARPSENSATAGSQETGWESLVGSVDVAPARASCGQEPRDSSWPTNGLVARLAHRRPRPPRPIAHRPVIHGLQSATRVLTHAHVSALVYLVLWLIAHVTPHKPIIALTAKDPPPGASFLAPPPPINFSLWLSL